PWHLVLTGMLALRLHWTPDTGMRVPTPRLCASWAALAIRCDTLCWRSWCLANPSSLALLKWQNVLPGLRMIPYHVSPRVTAIQWQLQAPAQTDTAGTHDLDQ